MNPNFLQKVKSSWLNMALATGSLFSMGSVPTYYRTRETYKTQARQYTSQAVAGIQLRRDWFVNPASQDLLIAPTRISTDAITLVHGQQVRELVIVDQAVPQKSLFYAQSRPGIEIVELSTAENGLANLMEILAQYENLDAVHLFSHASAGNLYLGGEQISIKDLRADPAAFDMINQAIKPSGDLLFYGCELGKGEVGEEFLEIIQTHTHVDLAASDDLTGSTDLQGDWELEIQKGNIEAYGTNSLFDTDQFNETLQIVEKQLVGESGQPLITIDADQAISYGNSSSGIVFQLSNYTGSLDLPPSKTLGSMYLGDGTLRVGFEIGGGTAGNPLEANDFSIYLYLYYGGGGSSSQLVYLNSLASSYDSTYFDKPLIFGATAQFSTMPFTWPISSITNYVNNPAYSADYVYMAFAIYDNDNNGGNDISSTWGELKIYEFFSLKWDATSYFDIVIDYAANNSNPAPSVSDFANMAIDGVSAGNLSSVNAAIALLTSSDVDTQAELQAVVDGATALPISLADFEVKRLREAIQLTWVTTFEQNNQGFEIEQSVDGETFEQIGFVEGAGNSNKDQTYTYSVWNPGAAYYRFKQVDLNGQHTYSPIRSVAAWESTSDPMILPSPITDEIFLTNITEQEVVVVNVTDLQGRQLMKCQGHKREVEQQLSQQFAHLASGMYLIRLRTEERTFEQKVIKE